MIIELLRFLNFTVLLQESFYHLYEHNTILKASPPSQAEGMIREEGSLAQDLARWQVAHRVQANVQFLAKSRYVVGRWPTGYRLMSSFWPNPGML